MVAHASHAAVDEPCYDGVVVELLIFFGPALRVPHYNEVRNGVFSDGHSESNRELCFFILYLFV